MAATVAMTCMAAAIECSHPACSRTTLATMQVACSGVIVISSGG